MTGEIKLTKEDIERLVHILLSMSMNIPIKYKGQLPITNEFVFEIGGKHREKE